MINVSNAFRNELYEGHRNYLEYVDIKLANERELNLTNKHLWQGGITIEDAVSSDNSFDVGAAIINKCTVTINNIYEDFSEYDFTDAIVVPRIGLELPDGRIEPVRKGTFTVDDATYNGSIITLSCLDNMVKFDKKYSESKLIYPATLGQIIRDACSSYTCNVVLQTDRFPHDDFVVNTRPEDEAITFHQVIAWAAQIACCFCRCDVYGRLELKWYDQKALEEADLDGGIFDIGAQSAYPSGDNADGGTFKPWNTGDEYDGGDFASLRSVHMISSNYSMNISVDDVVITGVRVLEKTKEDEKDAIATYQSGTDGYVVGIENNDLIQGGAGSQVAGWLGEQLIGLRFRKGNISHSSDPTIEAGDVGFLNDRKGRTYRIIISQTKFTTGGSQTTVSSAENPARNSADRFSANTRNYVENRKTAKQEISSYDQTVQEMTKLISQGFGMYFTAVPQEDGGKKWFMHDQPTIEESSYVAQMTSNGLMASLDGGTTWALDKNGNALFNVIVARGLNAGWITAGELSIKDEDGNETFFASTETGIVRITADSFRLSSGKTIGDIAQEKADSAAKDAVNNQTQLDIFNRLTNDGENQDLILEDGKLYFNGQFIQARNIRAVNDDNVQTFYIDNKGNLQINASSMRIMGADAASVEYVDSKLSELGENLLSDPTGMGSEFWYIDCDKIERRTDDPMGGKNAIQVSNSSSTDIIISNTAKNRPILSQGSSYEFSIWATSLTESDIYISCRGKQLIDKCGPQWKKYTMSIPVVQTAGVATDIDIAFSDTASYGRINAIVYNPTLKTSYSPEEVLNMLTNNGEIQGLFEENGRFYFSGESIQAKGLKVTKGSTTTFQVTSEGDVIIKAERLSWSSSKSSMDADGTLKCTGATIDGILTWKNTYSTMESNGRLTCTGASIKGTFESISGKDAILIENGIIKGKYDGEEYGILDLSAYYDNKHHVSLRGHDYLHLQAGDTIYLENNVGINGDAVIDGGLSVGGHAGINTSYPLGNGKNLFFIGGILVGYD